MDDKILLFEKKIDEKRLIKPESIKRKNLFYSNENQSQIDSIKETLKIENLKKIQDRLEENGMPKGICVLFHGGPGTGKTESVYQIAKETNRSIVHIDISKTKSCWFGESEKIIGQIFDDYNETCNQIIESKIGNIPILLFNEADGVFQKRTDITRSNVAKTENTIQNIILERMEKLNGILIATTNLAENLDSAFERRFLFKVKFDNPSLKEKVQIWKSKIDWISECDANHLASIYNFSGGEIDNVVRKATIEEIVKGSKVSIDDLKELCENEKINKEEASMIGFKS